MPFARPHIAEATTPLPFRGDGKHRLAFRVGGTCFELSGSGDVSLMLDPGLRDFAVEPSSASDVRIQVDWTDELGMPLRAPLFHSGGLWTLFEESGGYRFYFSTPLLGATPYKAAWFDPEFQ